MNPSSMEHALECGPFWKGGAGLSSKLAFAGVLERSKKYMMVPRPSSYLTMQRQFLWKPIIPSSCGHPGRALWDEFIEADDKEQQIGSLMLRKTSPFGKNSHKTYMIKAFHSCLPEDKDRVQREYD